MKRHKTFIPLSREHHFGLILANLIKDESCVYKGLPSDIEGKRKYAISFYEENLITHFEKEELLFSEIGDRHSSLHAIIDEIKREHQKIEHYVNRLRKSSDIKTDLEKLGSLLIDHIRKEERVLFERLQEVCSERELKKLDLIINHSADTGSAEQESESITSNNKSHIR